MNDLPAAPVTSLLDHVLRSGKLHLHYVAQVRAAGPRASGLDINFSGPDTPMLLARNAELLLALEHLATQTLRLEPEEHERVSFDAGGFKAARAAQLKRQADHAVEEVLGTQQAFHFRPMNSRERRLLHLALARSGLRTASEGEGPQRHLVLHPA